VPTIFPGAVYLLCFLTSSACAFLLARNYARTHARLLLWSALCFLFLAGNNLAVIIDLTQAILALGGIPVEERSWVYLIRLSAFLLILVSIGLKNRRA
jgi:hypothetical protein